MAKKIKLNGYFDKRGSLLENSVPEIMNNVKHFFISKSSPGVIRGNHYHNNKAEWFLVISGHALVVTEDIKTKEREEIDLNEKQGELIFMSPGKAHAIKNIGDNEMVLLALINEPFDQERPDTFEYKVI